MRHEITLRSAVVLSAAVVLLAPIHALHAQRDRSYVASRVILELDGKVIGAVKSVDGGYATSDVVLEGPSADGFTHKHIGTVKYVPLTLRGEIGDLDEIARTALALPTSRSSGRVSVVGLNGKAVSSRDFTNGVVSRIAISDLDGASKESGFLELTITPETIRRSSGGADGPSGLDKQKRFLRSNFKVIIPGVDAMRVAKVEGLTISREVAGDAIGDKREAERIPMKWNAANLVLSVSEAGSQGFYDWYDDFVVKGNNGADREKTIDIQLMAPDMSTPLLTVRASGVGVVALRQPIGGSSDAIARIEVELYVEKWEIVK